MSMRKRVFEILDKDATVPICELMRRVGCTRATAQYYHRIWRTNHQDRYTGPRCGRCDMPHDPQRNPLIGGQCLWCWADQLGCDVGDLAAEVGWPTLLKLCTIDQHRCTFCDAPAFTPAFVQPPMCEQHYELALLINYLERHNKPITVASVHRLMLRAHTRLHISAGELPTLLPDMLRKIESKEIR